MLRMNEHGKTIFPAATAAFLGYVALDFLTHAVVLESWWGTTEAHWLPPEELFRRIPVGYLSFLFYCAGLTVLLALLQRRPDVWTGARLGAIVGTLFGLTSALAAYSILPVPPSFLLVAPASAIVGSTAAGAAAGSVLATRHPWRRVGLILGLVLVLFVIGVIAQSFMRPH